jgi:hypothetical protein
VKYPSREFPIVHDREGGFVVKKASEEESIWARAHRIDPRVTVSTEQARALERRHLSPVSFSSDALFAAMAKGRPVLFDDLPVRVRREKPMGTRAAVVNALGEGFGHAEKVRVRCGPSRTTKYLTVDQLLGRWSDARAKVSVTDLHIRGTSVMKSIDCSRLSGFNLLAGAPDPVGTEEILTMVVSSAGTVSDSHTDDPDGSNHCFVGEKLWLVWDTFEGIARGLEDIERCDISGDWARFSIARFLAVPGSRWFTVRPGQTLFLPGHLTHRVITLERYIGVGSFFVMLPSYLRTLLRWTRHTPLWALTEPRQRRLELVDLITRRVTRKVADLSTRSRAEKDRWGLRYLQEEAEPLLRWPRRRATRLLGGNPQSIALLEAVQASLSSRRRSSSSV